MEHKNSIAIQVLSEMYSDYPANSWHYDREYKMIVRALEINSLGQHSEYSIVNNRIAITTN
jgi:catechol-2,3-dioxygenase